MLSLTNCTVLVSAAGDVDPADVCSDLLEYALASGSTDNMTAMLILFKDGTNYSAPDEVRPGPFFHGRNDRKFADAFFSDALRFGCTPRDPRFVVRALEQDMVRNEQKQHMISDSFDNELKDYYKVIEDIKGELASGKVHDSTCVALRIHSGQWSHFVVLCAVLRFGAPRKWRGAVGGTEVEFVCAIPGPDSVHYEQNSPQSAQ